MGLFGWLVHLPGPAFPVHLPAAAEPVFDSGVVSDQVAGHAVEIDVDIRGAETLYLVVTDAGDGITCDFANWAEPRLTTDEGDIDLTKLTWIEAESSWGEIRFHRNAEAGPMRIAGRRARGVGTHANSLIGYRLPAGVRRFRARTGLDTQGTDEGLGATVRFLVYTQRPDMQIQRQGITESEAAEGTPAVREFAADGFFGSGGDKTGRATPAESFRVAAGFRAELVYTVPLETQGSWVSLAVDPQGRLVASDQWRGLYRITLPSVDRTRQQPMVRATGRGNWQSAGLLFAHD